MIRKPFQLVLLFAILFAILIGIQVYFLMNSYSLKKREIFAQVKSLLSELEDDVDIFDDDIIKDDDALTRFIELEKGIIDKNNIKERYRKLSGHIQPKLTLYIDSIFAPLGYKVNIQKQITSVFSNNQRKELFEEPIVIYQSLSELKNKQVLSSGRWETSTNSLTIETHEGKEDESQSRNYAYTVKRISYFEISNLQIVLFRELFILITVSVFLVIAILVLFYKSYQNLIKQRRQIENLHDMVDNVSHELKTPVATLKVVSKTLGQQQPSEVIQILARQVDRLEQVLYPLTEQPNREPDTLFLQDNLDSYVQDFQFANPSITILSAPLPKPNLKVAKHDMETILSNLLDNSVKYGASHINLHFTSDDNLLRIIVEDNGKGINKKDQPYIFEKFYRIQKNNTHQTTGMGLGLYIVRQLLKKYKGEISVDSTTDRGTVFQIVIPHV